jgi:hypothetical protein
MARIAVLIARRDWEGGDVGPGGWGPGPYLGGTQRMPRCCRARSICKGRHSKPRENLKRISNVIVQRTHKPIPHGFRILDTQGSEVAHWNIDET